MNERYTRRSPTPSLTNPLPHRLKGRQPSGRHCRNRFAPQIRALGCDSRWGGEWVDLMIKRPAESLDSWPLDCPLASLTSFRYHLGMGSNVVTSPDRLESAERHARAFKLRLAGHDLATIAGMLGYAGKQGVHEALKLEMNRRVGKPCEVFRQLELARLDALWLKLMPKLAERLRKHDEPINLPLIDRLVKISLARGRLGGLERPILMCHSEDEEERG